eukprot:CFRG4407T1
MGMFGSNKSKKEADKGSRNAKKKEVKAKSEPKVRQRNTPPLRGSIGRPSVPRSSVGHPQMDIRESVARASFGDIRPSVDQHQIGIDAFKQEARASSGNRGANDGRSISNVSKSIAAINNSVSKTDGQEQTRRKASDFGDMLYSSMLLNNAGVGSCAGRNATECEGVNGEAIGAIGRSAPENVDVNAGGESSNSTDWQKGSKIQSPSNWSGKRHEARMSLPSHGVAVSIVEDAQRRSTSMDVNNINAINVPAVPVVGGHSKCSNDNMNERENERVYMSKSENEGVIVVHNDRSDGVAHMNYKHEPLEGSYDISNSDSVNVDVGVGVSEGKNMDVDVNDRVRQTVANVASSKSEELEVSDITNTHNISSGTNSTEDGFPISSAQETEQSMRSERSNRSNLPPYKGLKRRRVLKRFFDYKRVMANVFQSPRLIHSYDTNQHDLELKAGWTELFYDLIYVGAFLRLAEQLKESSGVQGVFITFLYMWSFFSTWMSANHYFAAYVFDDFTHHYITFVHMLGVVVMVLYIAPDDKYQDGFAIGFIISHAALIILHLIVAIYIRRARKSSLVVVGSNVVTVVIWFVAIFVESHTAVYILWTLGLFVKVSAHMYTGSSKYRTQEDVGYVTERLGLFVILVMGESILGIVRGGVLGATSTLLVAGFGFLTIFNLHLCYFETIPDVSTRSALGNSRIRQQLIYFGHSAVCFGLLCIGMGYETAMIYHNTTMKTRSVWIFCGGFAVTLISMQVIRTANQDGFHGEYYFATTFRLFLMVARCALPIAVATIPLWGLDTIGLVLSVFAVTTLYVALDVYGHFRYERELNLVLIDEVEQGHLGLVGLEYLQDPFPDFYVFVEWDAVEVRLWMKNDLQFGPDPLQKVEQFNITAEKLFQASAAEIIIVFGDKDGGRIVVELSRISSGKQILGPVDSKATQV